MNELCTEATHVVEIGEERIVEVETAVLENVALGSAEDPELPLHLLIEFTDLLDLAAQALLVQAIGLEGAHTVIGDPEVLEAQVESGLGHLAEAVLAVARGGVAMKGPAEVGEFHESGEFPLLGRLDLAEVFAELGLDIIEVEGAEDIGLLLDEWSLRVTAFHRAQGVLVEGEPPLESPAAHGHVVLLAAREVSERAGELAVGDHAQVALETVLEVDARLGLTLVDDAGHRRHREEGFHDDPGVVARCEEIEIVNRFLGPAETPGDLYPRDFGDRAEEIDDHPGRGGGLTRPEAVRVGFAEGDRGEDFLGGLGAETGQFGDRSAFNGGLESFRRGDLQLRVERLDLLGPPSPGSRRARRYCPETPPGASRKTPFSRWWRTRGAWLRGPSRSL